MSNDGVDLGLRLRQYREAQGMSLRDLARRTGLTPQFLSQVELGQANTSIGSLRRVADALNADIYYFLRNDHIPAPPQHSPVVRAGQRVHFSSQDGNVAYELLTPEVTRKMQVLSSTVQPGSGNAVRQRSLATEEWVYVLSGALRIQLEMEEYLLDPGDAIYFDGEKLRTIECASEEEAHWISVITPPAF